MELSADEIIELLQLQPLRGEGGYIRVTQDSEISCAIYFMVTPGEFSAMHSLGGPELWHYYAGAPASMLLLLPGGGVDHPVLGAELRAGQRPQVWVEAEVCMGASTLGEWSLLGTTMAPPFVPAELRFPPTADLLTGWPSAADRIRELTR
jgi:predicted cupin superfamily sugar epimerase